MDRMNTEFNRLLDKWASDLNKLSRSWTIDLEADLERYIDSFVKDMINPERFMDFIKRSGVDFTGISGAAKKQSSFDPYRILGLERSASDEDIKSRHRQLLWKLHPDTAEVEGTEILLQIVMAAYEAIKMERGWQ